MRSKGSYSLFRSGETNPTTQRENTLSRMALLILLLIFSIMGNIKINPLKKHRRKALLFFRDYRYRAINRHYLRGWFLPWSGSVEAEFPPVGQEVRKRRRVLLGDARSSVPQYSSSRRPNLRLRNRKGINSRRALSATVQLIPVPPLLDQGSSSSS